MVGLAVGDAVGDGVGGIGLAVGDAVGLAVTADNECKATKERSNNLLTRIFAGTCLEMGSVNCVSAMELICIDEGTNHSLKLCISP